MGFVKYTFRMHFLQKKKQKKSESYEFGTRVINYVMQKERSSNTANIKYCRFTGCCRRNLQLFRRKFLKLIYIHIVTHTYPNLDSYGDNHTRKMRSCCGSVHCT